LALRDHLPAAFGRAEPEHFDWQTRHRCVGQHERELVRGAFQPLGERIIDLGCGEGATLLHLGAPSGAIGVDLFEEKVAFARSRLPGCRFLAASVDALPFEDAHFDHVIVRDLIHHLDEPEAMIDEAWRVLEPGGRIDVLEPCRYNPLVALHALSTPVERGELRSTTGFLSNLLGRRFELTKPRHYQPLPLHRLVYHPNFGLPSLAQWPLVRNLVDAGERLAGRCMPMWAWSYIHVRAHKR
jgi:SAM-dependent methyltransferase